MNSKKLFDDFISVLVLPEKEEREAIAYRVFEKLLKVSRTQILAGFNVDENSMDLLEPIAKRLSTDEPVQYVLEEEYFFGRPFYVNKHVLIPRPETEDLVREVIEFIRNSAISNPRIVDIGTGSGCIPVTLSLEVNRAEVFATDISTGALNVANRNNDVLGASVKFLEHDILHSKLPINNLDVLISNPPYIARSERSSMGRNVVEHEPHLALFVPNEDPLIFYKAIVGQAIQALNAGGLLIVEINERFGEEVKSLFEKSGVVQTSIIRDLSGKERIVKGQMPE